jgi:hypothetical protein
VNAHRVVMALAATFAATLCGQEPSAQTANAASNESRAADGLVLNEDPTVAEPQMLPASPAGMEAAEDAARDKLIPEAWMNAYFGERPESFLTDPQKLISPLEYRERLEFLKYHAGDSAVDLYVHLIGNGQEIPQSVRLDSLMERWFSEGKPAVMVLYFMGEPKRTTMLLSPAIHDVVSAAERRRALESAMMQALAEADPARQFEALLMQMSIRIYGMETLMAPARPDGHSDHRRKAPRLGKPAQADPKAAFLTFLAKQRIYVIAAVGAAGVLAVLALLRFFKKRYARHVFPDCEVEPRLGGAHAAGVGAVISFASATLPPASQRDALPDYLRRA